MKIVIVIINLITMVLNGLVLSFGWNTFVLRIFELPRINAWTALALVLMYEVVVYKSINVRWTEWLNKQIEDDETERAMKLTVSGLSFILLVYLILFLLSLI
ncbi:hypothetical protein [Lactococcus petauri]|uniref:hypothetical protein n=1 Tax=Lactococcus petauri TaxID=1940789 RepID=UPI0030D4969B